MRTILLTLTIWSLALSAHAASLYWEAPNTGTLTVELRSLTGERYGKS